MISVQLGRLDEVDTQALLRPVRSDFFGAHRGQSKGRGWCRRRGAGPPRRDG